MPQDLPPLKTPRCLHGRESAVFGHRLVPPPASSAGKKDNGEE